ncbi:MAG: tetratricopeptide repeat protein [Planctomycetota bacterium]|nr:tetratricopeptide repeat protein [Planctomycetota bacterium]
MIHGTQQNRRAIPAILLLGLATLGFLNGCDGEASPTPAAEEAVYDRKRFEEGLVAIDEWLANGDAGKAEVIAARLVELDPDSIAARQAHGNCLLILGSLADQNGDPDAAERFRIRADEAFQSALARSGGAESAALIHQAALAASARGDLERALSLHVSASEVDPADPTHPIFAANTLTRLQLPKEAITWFDRAIEIAPDEPWAWAGRAECHRQLRSFDEALEAIRTARARSVARGTESGFPFRVAEGRILREAGQPRRAAELLFAVDSTEHTRESTSELAAACTAIEEHQRAAEAWERFHHRNQGDVDSMVEAARCWIRAGEPEHAASWLELAESAGVDPAVITAARRGE